jgi:hypothetical protein
MGLVKKTVDVNLEKSGRFSGGKFIRDNEP